MPAAGRHIPLALAALFVFGILVSTTPASVYHGDSGETISVSYTLGIQHPPGYPLITMLGKLFTFIPAGDVSFRIYLMSCFLSVMCFICVFFISSKVFAALGIGDAPFLLKAAPSFIFAAGFTVWEQAVTAKGAIYMLNILFFTLITLCLLAGYGSVKKDPRFAYLSFFLFGLSLSNHHMSQFALSPLYAFLFLKTYGRGFLTLRRSLIFAALALAGAFAYAYLPIRAQSAALNWGEPDTIERFLQVFSRQQYVGGEITRSFFNSFRQAGKFFSTSSYELLHAGFAAAIIGMFFTFRRDRVFFTALVYVPAIFLLLTAVYLNLDADRLYIMETYITPSHVSFAVFCALGVIFTARALFKSSPGAAYTAAVAVLSLFFFARLAVFYPKMDKSRYFFAHDYNRNLLMSLDMNSLLFTTGDGVVFPLWYFRYVKHYRTDVVSVGTAVLPMKWVRDNVQKQNPQVVMPRLKPVKIGRESIGVLSDAIIKLNFTKFPVYYSYNKPEDGALDPALMIMPKGLAFKVIPKVYSDPSYQYLAANRNIWKTYSLRCLREPYISAADKKTLNLYLKDYSIAANAEGTFFEEKKLYDLSFEFFSMAHRLNPNDHEFVYNMGNARYYRGRYEEAAAFYRQSLDMSPGYTSSWYNLGVTYYTMKKYAEALMCFRKVKELEPGRTDLDATIPALERMAAQK